MGLVVCFFCASMATAIATIRSPPPLGAGLRTSICLFSFVLGMLKIYCLSKICQYKNHQASCLVLPNRFSLKCMILRGDFVLFLKQDYESRVFKLRNEIFVKFFILQNKNKINNLEHVLRDKLTRRFCRGERSKGGYAEMIFVEKDGCG